MASSDYLKRVPVQASNQVWRRLQPRIEVTCKPPPGGALKPQLVALRDAFNPIRFSLNGFVKTIVQILISAPDADDRVEMADLLVNVLDEMKATKAVIVPQILALIPTLLDALSKEDNFDAACAQVEAVRRFAAADTGVEIACGLIKLVQRPQTDPEFRIKVIVALRDCGTDALTAVLGPLTTLLATYEPQEVRREACVSIGLLGADGMPAAKQLERTSLEDQDEEVRREAARALARTCQDVPKLRVFATLKDASRRMRLLILLGSIGADGRALRRRLAEKWDLGMGEDVPSSPEGAPEAAPEVDLSKWAIGQESPGKWQVFQKVRLEGKNRAEWRHLGLLRGLAKGRQTRLLNALAEAGGVLSRQEAIRLETRSESIRPRDERKLLALVKPELANLRKTILDAIKIPRTTDKRDLDPIPWERSSGGWRARVQIGYAIQEDTERDIGSAKLRFRTVDQLTKDERADLLC